MRMAEILGTADADELTGTNAAETIDALGGDDVLLGFDGDDLLLGRDGNDVIYGGRGADEIWTGFGFDRVFGDDGDDTIHPHQELGPVASSTETSTGEPQRDVVSGGEGNDTILGGAGELAPPLTADGGGGSDTISSRSVAADILLGGEGDDTITGSNGPDVLDGGPGDDALSWSTLGVSATAFVSMFGGDGNDVLRSTEGGPSTMDGGNGDDLISLGAFRQVPHESILGGLGFDTLDIRIRLEASGPTFDLTTSERTGIVGIERIVMSEPTDGAAPGDDPMLVLDRDSVLRLSDETDTLRIDGGLIAGQRLNVVRALGDWQETGDETIDGTSYGRFEADGAVILVADPITVEIVGAADPPEPDAV
jgi:hypothetical protein